MPARVEQTLADLNGLREFARGVLERGEHKIAQRMVVGKRKPVFECARKRVLGVGSHSANALTDIARRSDTRPFAQDARRAAVIGHRDHGGGFHAHGKERANGNGRTCATADDHGFQAAGLRHHGIGRVQRRERLGHGRVMGEMTALHMAFV